MVANRYPGDINQALIELGSTVCKVKAPNCSGCPIKAHCAAYQKENKVSFHLLGSSSIDESSRIHLKNRTSKISALYVNLWSKLV